MKPSCFAITPLLFVATTLFAQQPSQFLEDSTLRLTVRPHEMATGIQTAPSGELTLDSLPGYLVYIPKQAVGTRRVPLIVTLAGGGIDSRDVMDLERPIADKFGMILFAPDIAGPDIPREQVQHLDVALKQILRRFVIDPDRIALTGMSNGGTATIHLGCANLAIFSRIAVLSAVPFDHPPCRDTRPVKERTQFLLSDGIGEPKNAMDGLLRLASQLRADGHYVLPTLGLRVHSRLLRDRLYLWEWFRQSWGLPAIPSPRQPSVPVVAIPLLTTDILTKMTDAWTRIQQEPDSIRKVTRWNSFEDHFERVGEDRKAIALPIGQEQVIVFDMIDMPAFATRYRSVTVDLTKAGLTPLQEEQYRAAFISARATDVAKQQSPANTSTPVVEQNVMFIRAHRPEVDHLLDLMHVVRCEVTLQAKYGC